jgi:starch phosphorylase
LAELINETIGDGWLTDLPRLRSLEKWAADAAFQAQFRKIKRSNKERLVELIRESSQVRVSPDSLFDMQVKRIHVYKRQLLNIMHIVHDYLSVIEDRRYPLAPRSYVFAGKAAPGYWVAKQIIKLIHNVARVVNHDTRAAQWIKVVFIPDYRVSLAEQIIPAADISEQISTAGKEASGTSNMKFALNGALTIGTLDGANIEILEEVGAENIFIFGLRVEDVQALREHSSYRPWDYYNRDLRVKRVIDALHSNLFCPHEPDLFAWVREILLDENDEYVHLADLPAYLAAQQTIDEEYHDQSGWARKAILNVARMGKFSSDRTVAEYARDIWDIKPVVRD